MDGLDWKSYRMQADVLKALGHPLRLAVADVLRGGECCVCDIAERLGAERSNVSRHLTLMQRAGVLDSRKEGLRVIYSLATPCVLNFFQCIGGVLRDRARQDQAALQRL